MATIDTYNESNSDSAAIVGGGTVVGLGQTFTCSVVGHKLTSCKHLLQHGTADCTGNAVAKLYAHTGTYGSTGVPTGAALATSDAFDVTAVGAGYELHEFTFTGAEQYVMSNGTYYCITIEYDSGDGGKYLNYGHDASSPSHDGQSLYNTGSWVAYTPRDMCFYVYGEEVSTPGLTIAGRKVRIITDTSGTPTTALSIDDSQVATFASKVAFTQTDGNEHIDSLADGYLDLAATTAIRVNTNLTSDTDSTDDLGTPGLYWANAYVDQITAGAYIGKFKKAVASKTTTYQMLSTDCVVDCDATGGAFTVTLPLVSGLTGYHFHITKIDGSAHDITVSGSGAETINGTNTIDLGSQYDAMHVVCNGTEWRII